LVAFMDLLVVFTPKRSKRGQRVFRGGPSKQKPTPIFVLLD
jgi:hypothetical protein